MARRPPDSLSKNFDNSFEKSSTTHEYENSMNAPPKAHSNDGDVLPTLLLFDLKLMTECIRHGDPLAGVPDVSMGLLQILWQNLASDTRLEVLLEVALVYRPVWIFDLEQNKRVCEPQSYAHVSSSEWRTPEFKAKCALPMPAHLSTSMHLAVLKLACVLQMVVDPAPFEDTVAMRLSVFHVTLVHCTVRVPRNQQKIARRHLVSAGKSHASKSALSALRKT